MSSPSCPEHNAPAACEAHTLRIELSETQNALQTAEISLARECEAGVIQAVRLAINDAVRGQLEAYNQRDRVQYDCEQAYYMLEQAQKTVQFLESELDRLFRETSFLKQDNHEFSTVKPRAEFLPLVTRTAQYRQSNPIPYSHGPRAFNPSQSTVFRSAPPGSFASPGKSSSKHPLLSPQQGTPAPLPWAPNPAPLNTVERPSGTYVPSK